MKYASGDLVVYKHSASEMLYEVINISISGTHAYIRPCFHLPGHNNHTTHISNIKLYGRCHWHDGKTREVLLVRFKLENS